MDSTKEYIREQVRSNLEGHAIEELGLNNQEDISRFIESQHAAIERVVERALGDETKELMNDEGYTGTIDMYIQQQYGDFFRDCMCGLGIPKWDM